MWPVGSSGWPQNGQDGRPADTTAPQRRANARAAGGESTTRRVCTDVLVGLLGVLVVALDDEHPATGVPREGERVDAELVLDRA